MALLRRELYRQVKGPEVTHADRCTPVFDTDAQRRWILQSISSKAAKLLEHRELWRLLRTPFKEDIPLDESIG